MGSEVHLTDKYVRNSSRNACKNIEYLYIKKEMLKKLTQVHVKVIFGMYSVFQPYMKRIMKNCTKVSR